jgi:hypothetical protein
LCFAAAAGLACAQSTSPLEIRGTVVEKGLGVGGATVTLYEFSHTSPEAATRSVFVTTSTDPKGEFTFHPARAGEYYVEARKEGYFAETFDGPSAEAIDSVGDSVSLDQDHPSQQRRFTLIRLGELRGRVIDEDGKPLSNLRVGLIPPTSTQVVSDPDGYFTATKLRPGDYLVRIAPERGAPEILRQFSESDLKIVDEDLETSYWPGVPIPISSGAPLSVGTITVHKAAYYRAHLTVQPGDCDPDENWHLAVRTGDAPDLDTSRQVPCSGDFLVRNLLPGLHSFVLSTDDQRRKEKRWAVGSAEVTDHNVEVRMTMSAGADIIGRLVAADGAALPGKTTLVVTPVLRGWGFTTLVSDAGGTFQIHSLPGDPSQVSARDMGDRFYVKEVRYNGLPVTDGVFTPVSGPANLEIVIDDKAATISGSVAERGKVAGPIMIVAVKWPVAPDSSSVSMLLRKSKNTPADEQGKFQINGLAPGEYHVIGVTETAAMRLKPDILIRLLDRAEKVTLERGGSQSISLKIVEP